MKYIISATLIFSALTLFLYSRLDNLIIASQSIQNIEIGGLHHSIKGKLILPETLSSPPVLMINREPHYPSLIYTPLINALVSQGIGVFLLTKNAENIYPPHQGVNSSLSVEDTPLTSALLTLKSITSLANSRFGLLSFNSDNAEIKNPNLLSQLDYFIVSVTKEDALNSNMNNDGVVQLALNNMAKNKTRALFLISDREPIAVNARDSFIDSDEENAAPFCFAVVNDATKMLLKSKGYPSSSFDGWSLSAKLHFWIQGEKAWAPDAIESIAAWILKGKQSKCSSPG